MANPKDRWTVVKHDGAGGHLDIEMPVKPVKGVIVVVADGNRRKCLNMIPLRLRSFMLTVVVAKPEPRSESRKSGEMPERSR